MSVDTRTEDFRRIDKSVKILQHNCEQTRILRNKRDTKFNSILLGANVLFMIVAGIAGAWIAVVTMIGYSLWLGLSWMKERYINELKYIIDMQQGLHELEGKELELAMAEQAKKQPKVKKEKK